MSEFRKTVNKQMKAWVDGESVHNKKFNLCCPDFSCCIPELRQPKKVRKAFQKACLSRNVEKIGEMLDVFILRHAEFVQAEKIFAEMDEEDNEQ